MKRVFWSLVAVALAAAFCALGTWQLGRAQWKVAHRDALARATTLAPVGLAAALAGGETLASANASITAPGRDGLPADAPVRVAGSGRFANASTVLLDNQVREGRAGVRVFTLFRPSGAKRSLLVDRGWIPLARDEEPAIMPVKGRVEVTGLLLPPPAIGLRLGNARFVHGAEPPRLAYIDMPALREQIGVALFDGVLEPDAGAAYMLGPARGATPDPMTPERHRGYAVQWFGLALAVVVMAGWLLWKSRR